MKKLLVFALCLSVLGAGSLNNESVDFLCKQFPTACLSIYCQESPQSVRNCVILKNGDGFIVQTTCENYNDVMGQILGVSGFDIETSEIEKVKNLLNQIQVHTIEEIAGFTLYYGVMSSLVYSCPIGGKNTNIEIALSNEKAFIGSPIILGSF